MTKPFTYLCGLTGSSIKKWGKTNVIAVLGVLTLAPTVTLASSTNQVFPNTYELTGNLSSNASTQPRLPLERCGVAVLKAYGIFKVGKTALYRQDCQQPWALARSEPKMMLFFYEREIPARAFKESAKKLLERQIQLNIASTKALETFNNAYLPVKEGDIYKISYRPEYGLALHLNNQFLAALTQQPVANQYFAIWLGEQPFSDAVKQSLIGK